MARARLSKRSFEVLFEAIQRKYEQISIHLTNHKPKGKAQEYFGFGASEDEDTTLHNLFKNHPEVKKAKKTPSPKYLYNLDRQFQEIREPYDSVEVDFDFIDLYARFLSPARYEMVGGRLKVSSFERERKVTADEYESFEDFLKDHLSFTDFERTVQQIFMDPDKEGKVCEEFASTYTGYYYYYAENEIFSFDVTIDFVNASKGECPVIIKNLHRPEREKNGHRRYEGKVTRHNSCLSAQLNDRANGFPLNMILYTSYHQASEMNLMHGSLQGISSDGLPTASEVVLVKTEHMGKSIPLESYGNLDYLKYYFWFQRRYYRVSPRIITNLEYLEARKTPIFKISRMTGHYRVWTASFIRGEDGNRIASILQSGLSISPDEGGIFRIEATSKAENKVQHVMMSISKVIDKLCLSTHPKTGVSVINFVIMDIPQGEPSKIGRGVYCTYSDNANPVAAPFVYTYESKPVLPEQFTGDRLREILQNEKHTKLADQLFEEVGKQQDWIDTYLSEIKSMVKHF